jgi:hypothetical protein
MSTDIITLLSISGIMKIRSAVLELFCAYIQTDGQSEQKYVGAPLGSQQPLKGKKERKK